MLSYAEASLSQASATYKQKDPSLANTSVNVFKKKKNNNRGEGVNNYQFSSLVIGSW